MKSHYNLRPRPLQPAIEPRFIQEDRFPRLTASIDEAPAISFKSDYEGSLYSFLSTPDSIPSPGQSTIEGSLHKPDFSQDTWNLEVKSPSPSPCPSPGPEDLVLRSRPAIKLQGLQNVRDLQARESRGPNQTSRVIEWLDHLGKEHKGNNQDQRIRRPPPKVSPATKARRRRRRLRRKKRTMGMSPGTNGCLRTQSTHLPTL